MMSTTAISLEDEIYWLALRLTVGLGNRRAVQLLNHFRTPALAFRASRSELEGLGLGGSVAQSIASGCAFDEAVEQQERMKATGVTLIPLASPAYPDRLKEIPDAPPALFTRGKIEILRTVSIAVVGTRRPTPYGLAATERLTEGLVRQGMTITSGMARGIDTAAHRATLDAGGLTIAVFGCGLDHIYPAENRKLAEQIGERGLLLSDFPLGTPAHPQNFPLRNRIIAGISEATLVVEGAQYSGSAITAKLATEFGRALCAVPGNITSKVSWGPNLLIRQGAILVQDAADILEALPEGVRRTVYESRAGQLSLKEEAGSEDSTGGVLARLGPNAPIARAVLDHLHVDRAVHVDKLLDSIDSASPSEILAVLFELELAGVIRQLPGRNFVKVW
jgi:DNA processing protein